MKRYGILGFLALMILAIPAQAEIVQWDANGHYYEYVAELVSWEEAMAYAEAQSYNGNQGYLVTLTTAAENDFVYWNVLGGDSPAPWGDPWIGGYQNDSNSDPADNWHWVTEEPWDYTNWAPWEPNDWDELYGEMYLQFTPSGGGWWNDHHSLNPKPMIIEYSDDVVGTEESSWDNVKALYR